MKNEFNKIIEEEQNYNILNSLSDSKRIIFPFNSSSENFLSKFNIAFFCRWILFGGILNNIIPKWCSKEEYGGFEKSVSCEIIILSSVLANLKTSPFLIPLGQNITSCPNLIRKESRPLCTFSSNKNLILCRYSVKTFFSELSSEIKCGFNMLFCKRRIRFKNIIYTSSFFKHLKNEIYHDSSAFKYRLSVAYFTIYNYIIINFNSHNIINTKEVFKVLDKAEYSPYFSDNNLKYITYREWNLKIE